MPGIILFNRRWRFASDDVFVPAILGLLTRAVWFMLTAIALGMYDSSNCSADEIEYNLPHVYLWGVLIIALVSCCLYFLTVYISTRGLIFETPKRNKINIVIYCSISLLFFEVGWSLIGTVAFHNLCSDMHFKGKLVFLITVLWSWFIFLIVIVTGLLLFDPTGHLHDKHAHAEYTKMWENQCRLVCFCKNSVRARFEDIAQVIADILLTADLVPSDVVAALILLYENDGLKKDEKCPSAIKFNPGNEEEMKVFEDVTHFSKYAQAIYGWPLFVYGNPVCGLCKLGCCDYNCGKYSKGGMSVANDNYFACNYKATRIMGELKEENIVYYNYYNDIYKSPFAVLLDHEKRKVVVTIRGSQSMDDAITDISATYCEFPVPGLTDSFVHHGILKDAQYIQQDIEVHSALEVAFSYRQDYELLIIGHSLGAGVAPLLALLLREKYENAKVIAYCPPGGLMSKSLAEYCESFCQSVVIGTDMIPRLSHTTCHATRDKIIAILSNCNKPKYQVYGYMFLKLILPKKESFRFDLEADQQGRYLPLMFEEPPDFLGSIEERVRYMPGKILHLKRNQEFDYDVYWVEDATDFNEILITTTMVSEHMPDNAVRVLQQTYEELKPQRLVSRVI